MNLNVRNHIISVAPLRQQKTLGYLEGKTQVTSRNCSQSTPLNMHNTLTHCGPVCVFVSPCVCVFLPLRGAP